MIALKMAAASISLTTPFSIAWGVGLESNHSLLFLQITLNQGWINFLVSDMFTIHSYLHMCIFSSTIACSQRWRGIA